MTESCPTIHCFGQQNEHTRGHRRNDYNAATSDFEQRYHTMSGYDESEIGRLYEWASLTGDQLPEEYESVRSNAERG
ncbi:MAG: hypothetical protein V5A36_00430 [Natronomonas sp.]